MKKFLTVALVLALLGTCGEPQRAGVANKLVFAVDSTYPPMEFIDEGGNIAGFGIDMVREVATAAGFEPEFKSVPWDGIFDGLAGGAYDAVIASVTITEARREDMDFSLPYINTGQVLVVREESTVVSMADLRGKTVGAQIETTGAKEAGRHPGVALKTFDNIGLAMDALVAGAIDAIIVDTPVAANYAFQREGYKEKLKTVGTVLTAETYGIPVAKGNTAALELINKGIEAITASGRLDELKFKWGLK